MSQQGKTLAWLVPVLLLAAAAVIALIYFGTAEHRKYGDSVIASPEYQQCEAYLAAIEGVSMHDAIHYCYALHWGRRPLAERVGMIAALHTGPLSESAFRARYLTFGDSQRVGIARKERRQ